MNMTGQASRVAAMSFKKLEPHKLKTLLKTQDTPFYAIPKFDGVRCLATTNGLYTKNGHPINALFHIQQNVFNVLYREYGDFDPHSIVLDGELYAATSVHDLMGTIKSHPLSLDIDAFRKQQKVKYYVSDVFFMEKKRKQMPFNERRTHLKKILRTSVGSKLAHLHHLKGSMFRTSHQYEKLLEKFIKKGSDGIVVYHPKSVYQQRKRSNMIWKFLPRHVCWYQICSVQRNSNKILRVQCLNSKNRRFTLTSNKLDSRTKQSLLRHADAKNLQAKVQFYKRTPLGIPRFATIIGFRQKLTK